MSVTIVKPNSAIRGASTGSLGPINIKQVLSKLHLSPLIIEKSVKTSFKATKQALFCLQVTFVSSAKASVLSDPLITSLLILSSSK